MMNDKTEIVNYMNSCNKCFAALLGEENYPEIVSIKFHIVHKDLLMIGVEPKYLKGFDVASNKKIAITMWDKIKGYQVKGTKIAEHLKEYEDILSSYKNSLENKGINSVEITFTVYKIEEIYHVTPGKFAGKKVEMEV